MHFKFSLKQSDSGTQIVIRSLSKNKLISEGDFSGAMDGRGFNIEEKVDGIITLKGNIITTTIGHKSMSTTKQKHDKIYLCIYL